MHPVKLDDNLGKTCWSHEDCFGEAPMNLVQAFMHRNYSIGMHAHQFYEINVVIKGTGYHYIANQSLPVERGYVFVIPPEARHGYWEECSLHIYHILIHCAFFQRYQDELDMLPGFPILFHIEPYLRMENGEPLFLRLSEEKVRFFEDAFLRLDRIGSDAYAGREIIKNAEALYLIGMLCREAQADLPEQSRVKSGGHSKRILQIMEYINRNCSRTITVGGLAALANMSRSTFSRHFTGVCHQTPMDYVAGCRVRKAMSLLRTDAGSITEIAQECGFYDNSHLTKLFIERVGVSPKVYRVQCRLQEKGSE